MKEEYKCEISFKRTHILNRHRYKRFSGYNKTTINDI